MRSIVPGLKFSATMSNLGTSFRKRSRPSGKLQVDADAALVEVVAQVGGADLAPVGVGHRRRGRAAGLAVLRMLDLHHVRAEASEQLGGVRQRLHLLRREHAHPVERLAVLLCTLVRNVAQLHRVTLRSQPDVGACFPGGTTFECHAYGMARRAIEGVIARRLLVNYRVDPEVAQRLLPPPFRPQLVNDQAVAGICLLRMTHLPGKRRLLRDQRARPIRRAPARDERMDSSAGQSPHRSLELFRRRRSVPGRHRDTRLHASHAPRPRDLDPTSPDTRARPRERKYRLIRGWITLVL